jgi:2'-5' RNA ligase
MDTGKYFLAVVLPAPSQSQVMTLKEYVRDHFESKAALRSPAHITLHMPFDWKLKREEELIGVLQNFKFGHALEIELHNFNCFAPRVVYVDVKENEKLDALQKKLVQHVKSVLHIMNEAGNPRGFHPHVTIAFRDLSKEKFRAAWAHFKEQTFRASFQVDSFHLLKHSPGKWEAYKEFTFVP